MRSHSRKLRILATAGVVALAIGAAGCGDDDDTSIDDSIDDAIDDAVDDAADDAQDSAADAEDDEDEAPTEPAPTERTGTVTVAGTTTELADDDFGICETVNPAFENDVNIIGNLDDGTDFRMSGTLGELDPEFDGFVLGEFPDEEIATDLEVSRDGRTLSGTGEVEAGTVEFSFTC